MDLFGRKIIYTDVEEIDTNNVLEVLDDAVDIFDNTKKEIEYLYDYYKGKQPILDRVKATRPEICNKIVENRANEIVSFKTGYLVGEPIQYISRENVDGNERVSQALTELNTMMLVESKSTKDKELVEWQNICGTAYRMVLPSIDPEAESPFEIHILDPRYTFVVYSTRLGHKPMMCVTFYESDEAGSGKRFYSIYTQNKYFEVDDDKIVKTESYTLNYLPIIEYPLNNSRLGSFEIVIPLLDAINTVSSNRIDGIEQFIQSLLILYNAELPEGQTAQTIKEKGLVVLRSVGEQKADLKQIADELNQTETQTLKNDMYQSVLEIVGMPSQGNGSTGDSSNNGAIVLKNGWQGAETRAKDAEIMFKKSEREFLRLCLNICGQLNKLTLLVSNIEIKFTRRNYEDILSKSQVLTTLLNNEKVAPTDAFTISGLFTDPEEATTRGLAWFESNKSSRNTKVDNVNNGVNNEQKEEDIEPINELVV